MTDSEFIVFLPKLWVPTNFHTGSQELRFIRIFWIFWSCWRQAGWHGVLLVYIVFLFPLHCLLLLMLYTLMIWCNEMKCIKCNNWYSSLFKDYSFIIICCSAANCEILMLFCCFLSRPIFFCLFPFSSILFFFYFKILLSSSFPKFFFLNP